MTRITRMTRITKARRGWLALALAACSAGALAQTAWPERPITMIVPFPPGGVADTVARPVAEALSRELRQTVLVENKAGAGGALGIGQAARAASRCCRATSSPPAPRPASAWA